MKGRFVRKRFTSASPSIRGHNDTVGHRAAIASRRSSGCRGPGHNAGSRAAVCSEVTETSSRPARPRVAYGAGYKLSKEQFASLISDQPYRSVVAPLLRRWFAYEIIGFGQNTSMRSASGSIDLDQLHNSIQADSRKQHELYQTAMRLWR